MSIHDLIVQKRDGKTLSAKALRELVEGYVRDEIPDYQMAAFLMAVYFRGLSFEELTAFTQAMILSGGVFPFRGLRGPKIDKHSTGGVGDKTSLIVVPLLASLGVKVPMICGRSLGFTGGTVDKLESIPGFQTGLSLKEARRILKRVGAVMMAQSGEIAPADRRLYALRDVTGTVESVVLIASSILSKKAAEGIDGVVFDVKWGDGAFIPERARARLLAETLVKLGKRLGLKTVALMSSMEQPLGRAVGNALEVKEAIGVLKGSGPRDLVELSLRLSAWMLLLAKKVANPAAGFQKAWGALREGRALHKFREMILAQGGDPRVVEDPDRLPAAPDRIAIPAEKSGVLQKIRTRSLAEALRFLGAGRYRLEDSVNPAVGVLLRKKVGEKVLKGEALAILHVEDPSFVSKREWRAFFEIGRRPVKNPSLFGPLLRS